MTAALLTLLFFAGPQKPDVAAAWNSVQALPAGTQIRLTMKAGDVQGTFVAANDDVLVIHLKRGNFSVDRAHVKRLDHRLQGSNRARNVSSGVGAGLALGLLRGTIDTGENGLGRAMLAMPFMLAGAISGATASAVKWEVVYRQTK